MLEVQLRHATTWNPSRCPVRLPFELRDSPHPLPSPTVAGATPGRCRPPWGASRRQTPPRRLVANASSSTCHSGESSTSKLCQAYFPCRPGAPDVAADSPRPRSTASIRAGCVGRFSRFHHWLGQPVRPTVALRPATRRGPPVCRGWGLGPKLAQNCSSV
jgi:hypothetical protein